MKRKALAGLMTIALVIALGACAAQPPATATPAAPAAPGAPAAPEAEAPAPQFSPGQFTIRIATVVTGEHSWIDMAHFIQEELESRSDGAIEVLFFPGGQLGNDEATIDDMRLGTLCMVIGGVTNAAPFVPQYTVLNLPYLFTDRDQYESLLVGGGPVFNYIQRQYEEKGLRLILLGLHDGGGRNIKSNRPINSVSDMRGLSMRVAAAITENIIWSSVGALPIPMGFNDIYTAMQSGMIDLFEVTLAAYHGSALFEVAPYITLTEHQFTTSHVTFSELAYNRLPPEFQQMLREVAEEASRLGSQLARQRDAALLDVLIEEHGVTVITGIDIAEFQALVQPLHPELVSEVNGEYLLQLIMDTIN